MKKTTLLFFAASILSIGIKAQSFSAMYTFDSVKTTSGQIDPSFVPTATGTTFGSFSAIGTPLNSLAAARFDFADWAIGSAGGVADTLYSGMTGLISTSEYYEVTLTPTVGYTLSLDSIKFTFEHSLTGVRTYSVRSSADAYATNLTAVYGVPTTNVTVQAGNVFFLKRDNITSAQNRNIILLGGASFTNLSTPITFRFYGWNAKAASGTFSLDNVKFIGSTTVSTAINEVTTPASRVYPNPSLSGIFTAEFGNSNNNTTITVYNIVGKKVFSTETSSNTKQTIDLSDQANGSYFVNIKNDKENITKKIIVNK